MNSFAYISPPSPKLTFEEIQDLEGLEDQEDPRILQTAIFQEIPTVALLVAALMAMPLNLPVYVNGEGSLGAIEVIDPTECEPFQCDVAEIHVVLG